MLDVSGTELYNDKKGYLDVYTKETLLEKYVAWCNKFKEPYPLAEADHSTIVMIFGIPTVDASKADKLLKLILHLCDKKFKSQAFLKKEINIDNLRPILIPNSDKPGQFLPAAFIPCRVNSIVRSSFLLEIYFRPSMFPLYLMVLRLVLRTPCRAWFCRMLEVVCPISNAFCFVYVYLCPGIMMNTSL